MAGGMDSGVGYSRETLAERVARTRAREAGLAPAPPVVKHAWYDGPHGRQAALLLQWRVVDGRYDGRICVVAPDEGGGWAVVEMWVEAEMLAPA